MDKPFRSYSFGWEIVEDSLRFEKITKYIITNINQITNIDQLTKYIITTKLAARLYKIKNKQK